MLTRFQGGAFVCVYISGFTWQYKGGYKSSERAEFDAQNAVKSSIAHNFSKSPCNKLCMFCRSALLNIYVVAQPTVHFILGIVLYYSRITWMFLTSGKSQMILSVQTYDVFKIHVHQVSTWQTHKSSPQICVRFGFSASLYFFSCRMLSFQLKLLRCGLTKWNRSSLWMFKRNCHLLMAWLTCTAKESKSCVPTQPTLHMRCRVLRNFVFYCKSSWMAESGFLLVFLMSCMDNVHLNCHVMCVFIPFHFHVQNSIVLFLWLLPRAHTSCQVIESGSSESNSSVNLYCSTFVHKGGRAECSCLFVFVFVLIIVVYYSYKRLKMSWINYESSLPQCHCKSLLCLYDVRSPVGLAPCNQRCHLFQQIVKMCLVHPEVIEEQFGICSQIRHQCVVFPFLRSQEIDIWYQSSALMFTFLQQVIKSQQLCSCCHFSTKLRFQTKMSSAF